MKLLMYIQLLFPIGVLIYLGNPGELYSAITSPDWEKITLDKLYHGEAACSGDMDGDGVVDIVAHPFWYKGPDFKTRYYYTDVDTGAFQPETSWSPHMHSWCVDLDGDGKLDIVEGGSPGSNAYWFKNSGKPATQPKWESFYMAHWVTNEHQALVDLDGDGKLDLVGAQGGSTQGYYKVTDDPKKEWQFISIPSGFLNDYIHGLGVGDINGDGKKDLVIKDGVWLQPKNSAEKWRLVPFNFGDKGGADYEIYDINGDGLMDVVGSEDAHGWGMAWWEQVPAGNDFTFIKHEFMGTRADEAKYGVAFSQPHATGYGDLDGDGLPDVVVGKRLYAELTTGDPEPLGAPVLYWFKYSNDKGKVSFTPHFIDSASGVGTQINLNDLNRDGRLDILITNKMGTFAFINKMGGYGTTVLKNNFVSKQLLSKTSTFDFNGRRINPFRKQINLVQKNRIMIK